MQRFEINSEFSPTGDQPQAIDSLVKGSKTKMNQTLLGVTGSGKTEIYIQLAQKTISQGKM